MLSICLPAGADEDVAADLVDTVENDVVDALAVDGDDAGAEPPPPIVEGAEKPEDCVGALEDCEGGDDCCDDEAVGCL